MSWMELILRMLLCLLIAGIIGAVIGWLLRSLFGGNKTAELEESWRGRLAGKEKELETLRADSRNQHSAVEGQLADCNAGVKTHLAAIADHEAKYAELQASLNAKTLEFDKLSADAESLRGKLALSDSSSSDLQAKLATAETSLQSKHSELGDLTTKLAAATALAATLKSGGPDVEKLKAENDLLRKRIGSLEADLTASKALSAELTTLKDKLAAAENATADLQGKLTTAEASMSGKQSEIGDLTTKLAAAAALATTLKGSGDEAATLKAENESQQTRIASLISERDALQQQLGELQTTAKSQAEDWEANALQLSSDKDREIQELQKRVGELEPLSAQAKDWEVKYFAVLDEKQKESSALQSRMAELEPLGAQFNAIQAEAKAKDSQIHTLEARIRELETGNAKAEIVPDLIRIQGIGPVYFEKLSTKSGIKMQADLLERGKTAVGRREIAAESGIDEALILRWVNHCDLRRISGVDEQYAELLEVAGVDSVPELAQRNADNLHAKVVATNEERHVSPDTPTADDIRQWVEQAKTLGRVVTH